MTKRDGVIISIGSGDDKKTITSPSPVIRVDGETLSGGSSAGVDLVFVIDTTGSMSDKIDGLLATCERFVDAFSTLDLNHRIAIVAFGDLKVPGDKIVRTQFTDKVRVVKKSLRKIPRYGGGGNEGESSLEALNTALALDFRANAVKVILLITDEPAHQDGIRAADMTRRLRSQEVLTFVVSPALLYFKDMAKQNGGRWYPVAQDTDFTDLLAMFGDIAEKVSHTVSNVYALGDGSVSKYLQLKPPTD
jgi:hypothetical protein